MISLDKIIFNLLLHHDCVIIPSFGGFVSQNEKAKRLAEKFNKPTIVGNDAHLYSELKLCLNFIESELEIRKSIFKIDRWKSNSTKTNKIYKSQLIKGIKSKNLKLIKKQLINLTSITISNLKKSVIG